MKELIEIINNVHKSIDRNEKMHDYSISTETIRVYLDELLQALTSVKSPLTPTGIETIRNSFIEDYKSVVNFMPNEKGEIWYTSKNQPLSINLRAIFDELIEHTIEHIQNTILIEGNTDNVKGNGFEFGTSVKSEPMDNRETLALLKDCRNMLSQCESSLIGRTQINLKIIELDRFIQKLTEQPSVESEQVEDIKQHAIGDKEKISINFTGGTIYPGTEAPSKRLEIKTNGTGYATTNEGLKYILSVKSESAEDKKQHAIGFAEFIGNNKSIYIKHKMVWVTKNPKLESIYTTNELYTEYLNTLNNK